MRVLLTGGLGFVGSELARELLARGDVERLVLLARGRGGLSAAARFRRLSESWQRFPVACASGAQRPLPLERVEVVEHDLSQAPPPRLAGGFDYVVHAAASTDLGEPLHTSRRANLYATEKLLQAAHALPGLKRFVHFSTAYVCGRRSGVIREHDHPGDSPSADFHNFYEQSKWESERCVRASGLPYTIVRPSMVVGRSDTGYAQQMKVLYSVWRIWLFGQLPRAPLDRQGWVDIVPVDYVAKATAALMADPAAASRAWHVCAGQDRQRVATLMHTAAAAFGVKPPPTCPPWVARALHAWPLSKTLPHQVKELLDYLYWHLPYLDITDRLYDTAAADALLGASGVTRPSYADYGERLFRFLKDTAWGKRPLAAATKVALTA